MVNKGVDRVSNYDRYWGPLSPSNCSQLSSPAAVFGSSHSYPTPFRNPVPWDLVKEYLIQQSFKIMRRIIKWSWEELSFSAAWGPLFISPGIGAYKMPPTRRFQPPPPPFFYLKILPREGWDSDLEVVGISSFDSHHDMEGACRSLVWFDRKKTQYNLRYKDRGGSTDVLGGSEITKLPSPLNLPR